MFHLSRYYFVLVLIFYVVVIISGKLQFSPEEDAAWMEDKTITNETGIFFANHVHVLRLRPGEDLLESLWRYARVKKTKALTILSIVGSLTKTNIRYANDNFGTSREGHFEIVSVMGNIDAQDPESESDKGQGHVHIALTDEVGNAFGGHLLRGNTIFTTAEVTMLELNNALFYRVPDTTSGYNELKVRVDHKHDCEMDRCSEVQTEDKSILLYD